MKEITIFPDQKSGNQTEEKGADLVDKKSKLERKMNSRHRVWEHEQESRCRGEERERGNRVFRTTILFSYKVLHDVSCLHWLKFLIMRYALFRLVLRSVDLDNQSPL